MTKEFKVGQKVKLTRPATCNKLKQGDVAIVSDVTNSYVYVNGKKASSGLGLHRDYLEVVFDISAPVFTAEGTPVVIITTQGRDPLFPVLAYEGKAKMPSKYSLDGKSKTGADRRHLTNVQIDVVSTTDEAPKEFFVNLYDPDSENNTFGVSCGSDLHASMADATKAYNAVRPAHGVKRVGIAKVTLVRGRLPKSKGG